jgi:hypothetical protein
MWQKLLDWAKYFLKHKEQTDGEELIGLVERLKQENDELRKRLEQPERS